MPRNKKKPGDDLLSRHEGSTIGVGELNFRVRNGNGCGLSTIITGHYLHNTVHCGLLEEAAMQWTLFDLTRLRFARSQVNSVHS